MTPQRLDRTNPPPGRAWSGSTYTNAQEWETYLQDAAPAVDDALARLVEWLRADASGSRDDRYCNGITAAIELIESGEWRNG